MVKFKPADFNNARRNKFSDFDGILFYGPDRGQVLENFNIALECVVPEVDDGFSVFEFSSSDIKDDPSKLIDEATAISFLGTRKVIKIKDATDDVAVVIKDLLKNYEKLEAFILVSAEELSPNSKLRNLFEVMLLLSADVCLMIQSLNISTAASLWCIRKQMSFSVLILLKTAGKTVLFCVKDIWMLSLCIRLVLPMP